MVRLKHTNGFLIKVISPASQFHYGSIKTKYDDSLVYSKARSQFHYGSIKTNSKGCFMKQFQKSQFHYGSIKTKRIIKHSSFHRVSIPLWFD